MPRPSDTEKQHVLKETAWFEQHKRKQTLSAPREPKAGRLDLSTRQYLEHQVESEPYWFQKIELFARLRWRTGATAEPAEGPHTKGRQRPSM